MLHAHEERAGDEAVMVVASPVEFERMHLRLSCCAVAGAPSTARLGSATLTSR